MLYELASVTSDMCLLPHTCYTMFLNVYHELLKEIVFVWFFVGILLGGGTPSSDINLSSQWAKHWGLLSPQFLLIGNEPRVCMIHIEELL